MMDTYCLSTDPSECGGNLTSSPGTFQPLHFDEDMNCIWRILAGKHEKIRLAVFDVDIDSFTRSSNCSGEFFEVSFITFTHIHIVNIR